MTSRIFAKPRLEPKPNFENILAVLRREKPSRPTLFEFFMNAEIYSDLSGNEVIWGTSFDFLKDLVKAFSVAGYDYATWHGSDISFKHGDDEFGGFHAAAGTLINNRKDFEAYPWPDPDKCDYSSLERVRPYLPHGMKLIVCAPSGVLENAISLVGFENLCFMIIDEPELVTVVFNKIGSILIRHYEIVTGFDTVGACISNDDWGFKTQSMLSPDNMKEYVVSVHRKIAKVIHDAGKPVILHSCGNQKDMYDSIIDDIGYDGKHSYEDAIQPVEDAYEQYGSRIAIMGGIDLDFVCRSTPQEVYDRSKAMLEQTADQGGYALGTGNSVPDYVPFENYYAMISAALDLR